LACQDRFGHWLEKSPDQQKVHGLEFGRRAVLEQVAHDLGLDLKKVNRHGLGPQVAQNPDPGSFVEAVFKVYDFKGSCLKDLDLVKTSLVQKTENQDFEWLAVLTGLQSFLQILLEYLVVIDKVMLLQEHGVTCDVIELFDEAVSPRCLLLYCRTRLRE
jgi:hypothetical protein